MKRIYLVLMFVNLMIITIISISCNKYTDCTGIITVMKSRDGSVAVGDPVEGCTVYIGDTTYAKTVYFVGTTDANGEVKNVWANEANLVIKAVKDDMTAIGVINLRAGEVVEQTVWLKQNVD